MKTTFNIQTNNFDYSNAQLFVELAPQQVSLLVLDVNNCFNNYLSYSLTGDDIHEKDIAVKNIFNESLLQDKYKKVTVIYTFPESIITPAALINDSINSDMLSLVFGPGPGYVNKSDFLSKYNLYNIYRISSSLYKIINEKFPGCNESHQFSILPGIGDGGITILCVFYNNGCSIRLQMVKIYYLQIILFLRFHQILYITY